MLMGSTYHKKMMVLDFREVKKMVFDCLADFFMQIDTPVQKLKA